MVDLGLNAFHVFSFEHYYNVRVAEYFHRVGVLGDYYDICDTLDFSEWLEFFSEGIIDEMMRVIKILETTTITPKNKLNAIDLVIVWRTSIITPSDDN